jgi:glycerol-3-phosphate O-acyltransferase / dihydroxyacetone phosphate acyltransferase
VVIHYPILAMARMISKQKAEEALKGSTVKIAGKDVIATWKILAACVVTPVLYGFLGLLFFIYLVIFHSISLLQKFLFTIVFVQICLVSGWASLIASEVGMDIVRSFAPLYVSITSKEKQVEPLRHMRTELTGKINEIVTILGPKLFGDKATFDSKRIIKPEDIDFGERLIKSQKSVDSEFNWDQVDPNESNLADDVFLFKDYTSGSVKGALLE